MTTTPADESPISPDKKTLTRRWTWILAVILALGVFAYTQLTIFVIQPIGAIPEGRTLVMWRIGKLQFIDSADAICERETGSVNLFCRAGMMGGVAAKGKIILRLPYSETLYKISTGGASYDR